jgi:hypothetical protein
MVHGIDTFIVGFRFNTDGYVRAEAVGAVTLVLVNGHDPTAAAGGMPPGDYQPGKAAYAASGKFIV